jgi:hypothetical protein
MTKKLKTIMILSVVSLLLILSISFLGDWSSFSLIGGNDTTSEIGNCKFVMQGDVCDKYTECIYDTIGQRSCIKGYEIVSVDLPPPQLLPPPISTGGSQ